MSTLWDSLAETFLWKVLFVDGLLITFGTLLFLNHFFPTYNFALLLILLFLFLSPRINLPFHLLNFFLEQFPPLLKPYSHHTNILPNHHNSIILTDRPYIWPHRSCGLRLDLKTTTYDLQISTRPKTVILWFSVSLTRPYEPQTILLCSCV